MGYIKKLKNNELVGGTDKITIYPVTSTEAVFEEITNGNESSFKSQKIINGEHDDRIKGLENEMPDTVKSITINGGTEHTVDESGNVDLTIYTVNPDDPDVPAMADLVDKNRDDIADIKEEIGTDTTENTLSGRIKNLETTVGTGGTVDSRIATTKAELEEQIAGKQKTLSVGAGITLTSDGVISATADPSVAKVVETLPTGDDIVNGLIYLVKTDTAGTYSQHVHSTNGWSDDLPNVSLGITTDNAIDSTSTNPIQNNAITAQIGYFVCAASGSDSVKNVDAPSYSPSDVGGAFKIKMNYTNTCSDTVYLQFNSNASTKKELRYNRQPVTPINTWDSSDGNPEVISVYYDGTYYQASNSQGGGGNAEKIKYDNSASGLTAENVQGALDEIQGFNTLIENINKATLTTGSNRISSAFKWVVQADSHYFIPCVPGDLFRLTGSESVNYAFVTRYDVVAQQTIYPSSIYTGEAPVLLPDEVVIVEAPSDAVGLVINKTVSGVDKSPSLIERVEFVKPSELKEEIDGIKSDLNVYTDLPITSIGVYPYRLTTAKGWTTDTDKHYWIPCQAGDTFKIIAGSFNFNYAFLRSHNNTGAISADVSSIYVGMDCPVLFSNQSVTITCPSDAIGLAINEIVSGSDTDVSKIERITSLKDEIDSLNNEVSTKTQILGDIRNADDIGANGINANTGGFVTSQTTGHTDYLPTNGAQYILLYTPDFTSSVNGLAFYNRKESTSYISGVLYTFGSSASEHTWRLFEVPQGANFFRASTFINVDIKYRLVVTTEYLMELFKDSADHCLATHIFRSAKMVSEMEYKYAFPVQQVVIIDGKAYITYFGSETTFDDDVIGRPNSVLCRAVVNLCDMSCTTEHPTVGSTQYADGTTANPVKIGYVTECPTPNNSIAKFGLMRFNNKNPYYCWAIEAADVTVNNWKTCKLNYQANGTTHNVDFTINAYRQMLIDMGYTQTYVASTLDMVDNVNIHYDKTEGIYYAVLCGTQSSSQILPIVLMESADLSTWSPMAYLGINTDADEIGAIYKEGIVYVAYRTYTHGMNYVVYDVEHNTLISSGKFPTSNDMRSKPDVFTFDNNVYMAVNVNPSVYGDLTSYQAYYVDARQEIAIYKVVDGVPKFFRRVNNPTGLQYFSFMETPPMYANEQSAYPMYAQGAIYCAFSEDRRHLYRRQVAQVSFADVTALFADFGRI